MRTVVTSIVAALLCLPIAASAKHVKRVHAHPHVKPRAQPAKSRARIRVHGPVTLAARSDELQLSEGLLRQLQMNLIEGGYLRGTIDGRLSERTRRALADFQREYHLPGTGELDRSTAEALLGHDAVSSFLVAHK